MVNRKKVWLAGGIMSAALICMVGCGSEIPELSEQQTEIFTEYAAGAVLKEMPQSGSRLVDTSVEFDPAKMTKYEKQKLGIAEPETSAPPSDTGTQEPEAAPEDGAEDQSGNDQGESQSAEKTDPGMSVAQVLGIDNLDVALKGYSAVDNYPEVAEGTDLFFATNASPGNKLLVAKLAVTNTGSEPVEVNNVARSDLHFKMVLNDEKQQNAVVTLLNDDFSSMKETLEPGQTVETVLICEVSEELAGGISKLSVIASTDAGKARLEVQ